MSYVFVKNTFTVSLNFLRFIHFIFTFSPFFVVFVWLLLDLLLFLFDFTSFHPRFYYFLHILHLFLFTYVIYFFFLIFLFSFFFRLICNLYVCAFFLTLFLANDIVILNKEEVLQTIGSSQRDNLILGRNYYLYEKRSIFFNLFYLLFLLQICICTAYIQFQSN